LLLLFAGHETLTSAITSLCLLLAQYPEVLAKARAEQEQLAGPLNLEQLKQMSYLEQVLKEVLRLIPPVGGGFRSVIRACEFNGYALPEGWSVLYQISQTHQDPQVYPQPDQFKPDRFQAEGSADKQQPFGYVPFGGGIRECLGREFAKLEMKIFASLLIRHCDWELLPGQNLNLVTVPTPHPQDGLRVRLRRR
jgi:cytochrome P450